MNTPLPLETLRFAAMGRLVLCSKSLQNSSTYNDSTAVGKATINLDATFTPPIFKWDGIPARFFEMLYESLNQRFTVAPQELQVSSGNTFGDTVAKYKILNSNNTISLSVEKFSAEFPMALRNDYPVIEETLLVAGAGFSAKFPEYQITQVHGAGSEHAVLVSDVSVTDYLSQFEVPEVSATVDSIGAT